MKLLEVKDNKDWNRFIIANSSPASFLQSWEWGEFQQQQHSKVIRWGVYNEAKNPLGLISLVGRKLPLFGGMLWYGSRGPVIRGGQAVVINILTEQLGLKHKGTILRLMPAWSKAHDKVNWIDLGFQYPSLIEHQHEPEVTWLTSLAQSEEYLLSNMHQKTRYNIKLAERKSVKGYKLKVNSEEFRNFYSLLKQTAKRQKIRVYSQKYYEDLLSLNTQEFKGGVFGAYLNGQILATALVIGFGDTLTYLHGGSTLEHRQVMAPYALHWEIIKWGKSQGYKYYDWWGIEKNYKLSRANRDPDSASGQITNYKQIQNSNDQNLKRGLSGVTRFKKGFGGQELELAGTYDYVLSNKKLKLLTAFKRIHNAIKR